MTIRDTYTMNINTDMSRERKTVNNLQNSVENGSKRSSQARGSKNKIIKTDSSSSFINEIININQSLFDRASDNHDNHLLFTTTIDSTNFHVNNSEINNFCKYECNVAAKENLVPDNKHEEADSAFGSLGSNERRNNIKRHRNDNDDNNIEAEQDFNEIISNETAGINRDGLKVILSRSPIHQRHYSRTVRKIKIRRRKSVSSYLDKNLGCRVSIDLTRIQSLIDSCILIKKKKNFNQIHSYDDSKLCSTTNNDIECYANLRRTKSESNIPSIYSTKNFDHYFGGINYIDSQKYHKRKKRKTIDKHECVR